MDRGWRVVDCSQLVGSIHSCRGGITIRKNEQDTRIPVEDIAVVLIGDRVSFSGGVIHRLTDAGISVLFVDWKQTPVAALNPWSDHSRTGARIIAQARLTEPRRKNAWMRIVKAKVSGQANVLEGLQLKEYKLLNQLQKIVRSGDPENIEAQAARIYWASIFEAPFRRDRDASNAQNAMLNYGYTILRGHAMRAVCAAGLTPGLGLFHHGRSNPFNLADDLIEPFRPAIDWTVANMPTESTLDDPIIRKKLVAAADTTFAKDGARVSTVCEHFAQQLGQYFEYDVDKLTVPVFDYRIFRYG